MTPHPVNSDQGTATSFSVQPPDLPPAMQQDAAHGLRMLVQEFDQARRIIEHHLMRARPQAGRVLARP